MFDLRRSIIVSFRLLASMTGLSLLLTAIFPFIAVAESRNPPPVFESDYQLPQTDTPAALITPEPLILFGYTAALVLAGLAVYRWRSRKAVFCFSILSVAMFGFLQEGCPCPVGMFQNIAGSMTRGQPLSVYAVILFTLPLLAALFFGRIFCSCVCPFGAVQELTAIKNWKIPESVDRFLGLFRYVYLGLGVSAVALGLGYYVCRFDPYAGFFRFGGLFPVLVFSAVVLLFGMFIGRPFCRFLCPYGALLGLCGSLSKHKVSVTPDDCSRCQLCETVCPYNAVLAPKARSRTLRNIPLTVCLLMCGLFPLLGYYAAPKLAPLHHTVRTAMLLYAEEQHLVELPGTFSETRAVSLAGTDNADIYQQALTVIRNFRIAGVWFGVWCAFVLGCQLIAAALPQYRKHYEVDSSRCFACGRCFWYCPNQKGERLLLKEH